MASAEERTDAEIVFRGSNGNKCEAFVVAIRDLAFAKGQDEDPNWMLRFATTRLRGKALRWHAKLDPSIRKDWDLFVQALFEEYPFVDEGDEGGIGTPIWTSTTFSPAPSAITLSGNDYLHVVPQPAGRDGLPLEGVQSQESPAFGGAPVIHLRVYNPSLPGPQIGRLRIVYDEGGTIPQYVERGQPHHSTPDIKNITTSIQEALIVMFIFSSDPHQLGCMNSRQKWAWNLGVQLFTLNASEFHPLVGSGEPTVPCSQVGGAIDHQIVSSIWNILPDGTVRATLTDLEYIRNKFDSSFGLSESYCTAMIYVEIPGATISFAKEYSTLRTSHPISGRPIVRARIVFEPL